MRGRYRLVDKVLMEGKIKVDFKELVCEAWTGHMRPEIGTVASFCEYDNTTSG